MVSIIIPAYNCKTYIASAIRSALSQSYADIEVLAVDNNSTDGTAEIIRDFCQKDGRVRYLLCRAQGVSHARNYGIEHAVGEYLFFLDADDVLDEKAIEILLANAAAHKAQIAACNIRYLPSGKLMDSAAEHILANCEAEIAQLFCQKLPTYVFYTVFKLISRPFVLQHGLAFDPTISVGEDCLFILSALQHATAVSYCGEALYHYRITEGGLNSAYHAELPQYKLRVFEGIKAYLTQHGLPCAPLYLNLVNDVFALVVNECSAEHPCLQAVFDSPLTRELLRSGVFKALRLQKKVFYIALKFKAKGLLRLMVRLRK
jgi:glycosyltransferase involved in cell wall biosynthesis